jgi:Helix-turn-helix domain
MIMPPDETFSAREAAEVLRKSERQVQRYLNDGTLAGKRKNGRWQITALAIWDYQGIAQEMRDVWVEYCVRMAQNDSE